MMQKSPMYSYIPAKDLARARQFYEQKVGLKPKQEIRALLCVARSALALV